MSCDMLFHGEAAEFCCIIRNKFFREGVLGQKVAVEEVWACPW